VFFLSVLRLKMNPTESISAQKESFERCFPTLLDSKNFSRHWAQSVLWQDLLGSYISNKVISTLMQEMVWILESKTWSNGVFWVLKRKMNPVQSIWAQKEILGDVFSDIAIFWNTFLKSLEHKIYFEDFFSMKFF